VQDELNISRFFTLQR